MAVPTPTHLSPIIRIRTDRNWVVVERTGRFSMEADCARDPRHCLAAVNEAQELFIENRRKSHGEEYVQRGTRFSGFLVKGPYPHVGISSDTTPDPGYVPPPDPRDVRAMERWERAEKARRARALTIGVAGDGLVDYELVANFRVPYDNGYRTHQSDLHEVKRVLKAAEAAKAASPLVTATR